MSLQYVDENIQMVALMIYIVYTNIHTLYTILFCASFSTKNPILMGKKEENVKHNYYSKVKMLHYKNQYLTQKKYTGDMSHTHMLGSIHIEGA